MHEQAVVRQFLRTFILHIARAEPVTPSHAAVMSVAQALGVQGRVALATETRTPTPRTAAAKVAATLLCLIVKLLLFRCFA